MKSWPGASAGSHVVQRWQACEKRSHAGVTSGLRKVQRLPLRCAWPTATNWSGGVSSVLGDGSTASMSYWTFPVFRRRGLATRAVVLVTRYAFDTLGVTEIEVEIEPDNVASRGVAQRAGFVDAGTIQASPGAGAAPRTMLRFVLRDVPSR